MRTINELYIVCLKYKVSPPEVQRFWHLFAAATLKASKIELETPYYVEVCAKYARANE